MDLARDSYARPSMLERVSSSNSHSRFPLSTDFFPPVTCSAEQHALFKEQADRLSSEAAQKAEWTVAFETGTNDWKLHNSHRHFRETGIRTASRRRDARDRDGHRQLEFCCVGSVEMPVDHCLNALYSDTTTAFRSNSTFIIESTLDAVVLNVLETRTDEQPHRYLGLNWMASRSPGIFSKNRDLCYLRSMGMTVDSQQTKVGYLVIQSVDLTECASLENALGLVRGKMSAVLLFKENATSRSTDVLWQGSMGSPGHSSSKLIHFVHDMFTSIVLNLHKVQEAKYMARQVKNQRVQRQIARERKLCYICSRKFNLVRVRSQCSACGENMCKDCEVSSRARAFDSESFDVPTPTSRPDSVLFCKKCVSDARCDIHGQSGIVNARANLSMLSGYDSFFSASADEEDLHPSTAGKSLNHSSRTSTSSLQKMAANMSERSVTRKGKRSGFASLYITAAIQMSSAGEVPMSPLSIRTEREKQRCRLESDPMEVYDGLDKYEYDSLLKKDEYDPHERLESSSGFNSSKYAASDHRSGSHESRDNDMASRLRDISQRAQEALEVTKRNSHMMSSDTSSAPRVSDLTAFKELDKSIAEQADLLNAIGFVSTGRVYMENTGYEQGGVRISASSSLMSEAERFEVIA
uniref:FYVE-type domain-containing protein n=1 Tax=Peronospora matthiolae TaxID=2874970 RepID=A0AAV1TXG7_9STRA